MSDADDLVAFGGIDLSGLVDGLTFDPDPLAEHIGSLLDGLAETSIEFAGRWDAPADRWPFALAPAAITMRFVPLDMRRWRAAWRASRPQIARMRTAYGRRRGRGRW